MSNLQPSGLKKKIQIGRALNIGLVPAMDQHFVFQTQHLRKGKKKGKKGKKTDHASAGEKHELDGFFQG